jgi:hypothetical protein
MTTNCQRLLVGQDARAMASCQFAQPAFSRPGHGRQPSQDPAGASHSDHREKLVEYWGFMEKVSSADKRKNNSGML